MRLLALLLMLCASPLWATQDRWPALFNVTGVAADDALNVRAGPFPDSPIIGRFGPYQRDIEVVRPNDRETWGLVNIGERTGWVSLAYLARQPGQWYGSLPDRAFCGGTEPFWTLTIEDGKASFSRFEAERQSGRVDAVTRSLNHPGRHSVAGIFERGVGGRYADFLALVSNEACSDGMSDRAYGYRIDMTAGNMEGFDLWSGCCALGR